MNKTTMYKIIQSNEEVKTDLSYIGGVIKRRRKEKKLTQQMIARGICSISYLSKIENSRMKADPMIIQEVSKRVGIYFDKKVSEKMLQNYIENAFTLFFYEDSQEMENFLEDHPIGDFFLVDGMIRYLIAIKKRDLALSTDYREILKPLFNTMPKDLQFAFVIALMIDHYQMHQFNEAINHSRLLEGQRLPLNIMEFLYHYYSYLSFSNVNLFYKSYEHYGFAQNVLPKLNHPFYFNALYLEKQFHDMKMNPYYNLSNIDNYIINTPADTLKNKVNIMILENALRNKETNTEWYHHDDLNDEAYYHLMYLKLVHLDEPTNLFDEEVPYFAKPYQVMVELSKITDRLGRVEFIKSKAIPTMKLHENITFLKVLFEEIIEHYQTHSRYREALSLVKKKEKIFNKIIEFEPIHV